MRTRLFIAGVVAGCLFGDALGGPIPSTSPQRAASKAMIFAQCTPRSVQIAPEPTVQVKNPIAYALERAGPGSVIRLGPGVYRGLSIGQTSSSADNARTTGGLPGRPIVVEGGAGTRIRADGADAIFIAQQLGTAHIRFRDLRIEAGWRSGVLFARGGLHEGFSFQDCDIDGGFNHATGRGRASKWGVHGSGLKDFEYRGVTRLAKVTNLRDEHAFYLQNLRGDVTIERVIGANLGRTFVQITARSGEGNPGVGKITIRDCSVRDCGIAPGDGFKGGFAFTFAGRHRGSILVERCSYRAGLNPALVHRTEAGDPYGTGALVATTGGESEALWSLVLRDNDFVFPASAGDRPVVQLEAAREVLIIGKNRFLAGHYGVALRLGRSADGLDPAGPGPVRLSVSPGTVVRGRVDRHGVVVPLESLE